MQLSLEAVQSDPKSEVLYLDTEGGFRVERISQLLTESFATSSKTTEKLLSRIRRFRIYDQEQLWALLYLLPQLCSTASVKLVVLDGVAFLFRGRVEVSLSAQSKMLKKLGSRLLELAQQFDLAVVVTNQVTLRAKEELRPALGESWGQYCSERIALYAVATTAQGKRINAQLLSSTWLPEGLITLSSLCSTPSRSAEK